jgi:hypothetical protein
MLGDNGRMNVGRGFRLLAVVLCATGMLTAADDTTISVTVTNPYDKPVDNAAVILDFLGSHQATKLGRRKRVHWEVHTDQRGLAHFPAVPQGTLQLQVVAKNYQTFGKKYDVDTDQKAIDVKLNVPQDQYSAHPPLKPPDPPKPADEPPADH